MWLCSENDLWDSEELYDSVYQDEEDKIYDDLCGLRKETQRKSQVRCSN